MRLSNNTVVSLSIWQMPRAPTWVKLWLTSGWIDYRVSTQHARDSQRFDVRRMQPDVRLIPFSTEFGIRQALDGPPHCRGNAEEVSGETSQDGRLGQNRSRVIRQSRGHTRHVKVKFLALGFQILYFLYSSL